MQEIYKKIEGLIRASAKKHNLLLKKAILNSQAKIPKKQIHLYGKKEVQILKRPKQKTYIVGAILHKDYVGFYSMGYYAFEKEFGISALLLKALKGKSCFHIKDFDGQFEKEISKVIEKTIELFKKEGFI